VGEPSVIRTSSALTALLLSAISCLACAKGTEISSTEVVILSALPPPGPDAGADAGPAPGEPAPEEQVGTENEP